MPSVTSNTGKGKGKGTAAAEAAPSATNEAKGVPSAGSSREWTDETLSTGKDVMFDIDVQGGQQIRRLFPYACLIFLVPPSMEVLESRLRGRGTDDNATIERRLLAARHEIQAGLAAYDYVLTNASFLVK